MKRSLRRMTKAGVTVKTSDGKKFTFSPLELRHLAELEQWADDAPFDELKKKLDKMRDAGVSQHVMDEVALRADEKSGDPLERVRRLESTSGIYKMMEVSLKIRHPDISDDDMNVLINDHGVEHIREIMDGLSTLTEEEAKNLDSEETEAPPENQN